LYDCTLPALVLSCTSSLPKVGSKSEYGLVSSYYFMKKKTSAAKLKKKFRSALSYILKIS